MLSHDYMREPIPLQAVLDGTPNGTVLHLACNFLPTCILLFVSGCPFSSLAGCLLLVATL